MPWSDAGPGARVTNDELSRGAALLCCACSFRGGKEVSFQPLKGLVLNESYKWRNFPGKTEEVDATRNKTATRQLASLSPRLRKQSHNVAKGVKIGISITSRGKRSVALDLQGAKLPVLAPHDGVGRCTD